MNWNFSSAFQFIIFKNEVPSRAPLVVPGGTRPSFIDSGDVPQCWRHSLFLHPRAVFSSTNYVDFLPCIVRKTFCLQWIRSTVRSRKIRSKWLVITHLFHLLSVALWKPPLLLLSTWPGPAYWHAGPDCLECTLSLLLTVSKGWELRKPPSTRKCYQLSWDVGDVLWESGSLVSTVVHQP